MLLCSIEYKTEQRQHVIRIAHNMESLRAIAWQIVQEYEIKKNMRMQARVFFLLLSFFFTILYNTHISRTVLNCSPFVRTTGGNEKKNVCVCTRICIEVTWKKAAAAEERINARVI